MNTLIYPYLTSIHKYLHSLGISKEDQEDIVQDTYIRFWNANKLRHIKYPKTYIISIVHSIVVKRFKENSKHLDLLYQLTSDYKYIHKNSIHSKTTFKPSNIFNREEIKNALKTLTVKQRMLILLKYIYEIPIEDIAKKLNISSRSVNKLITTAMNEVKKTNHKENKYHGKKSN